MKRKTKFQNDARRVPWPQCASRNNSIATCTRTERAYPGWQSKKWLQLTNGGSGPASVSHGCNGLNFGPGPQVAFPAVTSLAVGSVSRLAGPGLPLGADSDYVAGARCPSGSMRLNPATRGDSASIYFPRCPAASLSRHFTAPADPVKGQRVYFPRRNRQDTHWPLVGKPNRTKPLIRAD